ncbi:MAG: hypothetical protein M1833_002400 [Piccolia ochrophora]|nr:MAG: hypothetical protein M1833_002400 [Piccolia ochrophora]
MKVEELEDDNEIEDIKVTTESPTPQPRTPIGTPAPSSSSSTAPIKRPRGRPRKHPLPSPEAQAKSAKGRSKTGCLTCRRRKKKCDETKPRCLHIVRSLIVSVQGQNCEKNAVVCEGYPERVVWKSGKQRAEEGRLRARVSEFSIPRILMENLARAIRAGARPAPLPLLVDGIETETDRLFLSHFVHDVSLKLTLINDEKNPFKQMLLPMAMQHSGLMHSLLCLAASHLLNAGNSAYKERQSYHYESALRKLRTDRMMEAQFQGRRSEALDDPTVATTLCLCLESIVTGDTMGQSQVHLDAACHMLRSQKSSHQAFGEFIVEFFTYHDVASSLTSLDRRPLLLTEDFTLPEFIVQPEAGSFLGVLDGLFGYISRITRARDRIRHRRNNNIEPWVDYETLNEAVDLDSGIRDWNAAQHEDPQRFTAAQLYRQCTWIYLYRTIMPSRPNEKIRGVVDEGLAYLRQLPPNASTQSILLMPVFLLGCAAFLPEQRPDIRRAFGTLKRYSNLGNIKPAREVVEQVWLKMDKGDESSWDWESLIQELGWNFFVT